MTINPTLAAAQIERQIKDGTLSPRDANLSDDIRGILSQNQSPHPDAELLDALDALPFAFEIVAKHSEEKYPGMATFREQLRQFIGGSMESGNGQDCIHAVIADGTCVDCGQEFLK